MPKAEKPPTEPMPADQTDIADQIDSLEPNLDIGDLAGSLRDSMLELFRHRPKPWSAMTEAEQRDVAFAVERSVQSTVRAACVLLAAEDRPHIMARLEKFTAKGGKYQAALVSQGGPELAADLARLDGHVVLIISADGERYANPDGDAAVQPDEPPLEFDAEQPVADEDEAEELPEHDEVTGEIIEPEAEPAEAQ